MSDERTPDCPSNKILTNSSILDLKNSIYGPYTWQVHSSKLQELEKLRLEIKGQKTTKISYHDSSFRSFIFGYRQTTNIYERCKSLMKKEFYPSTFLKFDENHSMLVNFKTQKKMILLLFLKIGIFCCITILNRRLKMVVLYWR